MLRMLTRCDVDMTVICCAALPCIATCASHPERVGRPRLRPEVQSELLDGAKPFALRFDECLAVLRSQLP
jgi:hypothetical protein